MKLDMGFKYKNNRDWAEHLQIVTQIGLTMAGCIIFCFYIGRRLDEWFELKGIFTIVFILFGVFGGANVVYRQVMKVTDTKADELYSNETVDRQSIADLRKKHGIAEKKLKQNGSEQNVKNQNDKNR